MFIGRKEELRKLHTLINSEKASIGVIYGRRRIGKSELIKKAFEQHKILIFEGLENRPKQEQIENFLFQLSYQVKKEYNSKKIKNWREAFIILYEALNESSNEESKNTPNTPVHIVFDEFQWMANYRSK